VSLKTLIFVPTYNERDNVEPLCRAITAYDADVLFIDDGSSDGTAEILNRLALEVPQVKVIHRAGKLGVGSAHFDGITYAYRTGYDALITMDCDFTHPPERIPELIKKASQGYDIVTGSRHLQAGSLPGWSLYRKVLTSLGHLLTRVVLGMPYDATGAFRYYRLTTVPQEVFSLVEARGYAFFFESLYVLHLNGFKIGEVAIALPSRTQGNSKMDLSEIFRSLRLLLMMSYQKITQPGRFRLKKSA
jgi:dolichol-phosphate mannosyltransferase